MMEDMLPQVRETLLVIACMLAVTAVYWGVLNSKGKHDSK